MTNSEEITQDKTTFFEKLIRPHPSIQRIGAQRKARFSAILSIVAVIWTLMGIVSVFASQGDLSTLLIILTSTVVFIFAYLASRSRHYTWGSIILVGTISLVTLSSLMRGVTDVTSTLFANFPLAFIIGSILFTSSSLIALILVDIIAISLILIPTTGGDYIRDILSLLFLGIGLIIASVFQENTKKERLKDATETNIRLKNLSNKLEEQVEELDKNTRKLETQSSYLKGAAEISQVAASFTDTDKLSKEIVELVKENFNLYYVGLFLINSDNTWIMLKAGSGDAGKIMLRQKHKYPLEDGIIASTIKENKAHIATGVGTDVVEFQNPYLPKTQSEAIIPLRSRGRILGVITVQSKEKNAFSPEIITTLQTMADQIGIAFDNAELLAQSEAALESEHLAYGELSYSAWKKLIKSGAIPAYGINTDGETYSIANEKNTSLESVLVKEDGTALLPIKSHGKVLGNIQIKKDPKHGIWTTEEIALAETLSEHLSISLESARLFEDSRRRGAREHIISESSARIRESLDIEKVLEAAAIELHKILGNAETEVWIDAE